MNPKLPSTGPVTPTALPSPRHTIGSVKSGGGVARLPAVQRHLDRQPQPSA